MFGYQPRKFLRGEAETRIRDVENYINNLMGITSSERLLENELNKPPSDRTNHLFDHKGDP